MLKELNFNPAIFVGGYEKVPLTKLQRLEDKCSPSIEKGGVKLDSWQ
jgi:hypothetical protein